MHVMDLGVSQYLVGEVFMQMVESDFCGSTRKHVDGRRADNIKALRRVLAKYYKDHERARGTMSAIGRLTLPMLGTLKTPCLRSKAAECRNLVPLAADLVEKHHLGADKHVNLLSCSRSLVAFYSVMKDSARNMQQAELRKLQSHIARFLINWKAYGGHLVYKHHAAWHLAERAARHGNPRWYWTYADEQENRVMGTVAKGLAGGDTFYTTFLQKVLPEHA